MSYGLNTFAADVRAISREKGFDNPTSIEETEETATKLILIIDEVCEALHEVRETGDTDAFAERDAQELTIGIHPAILMAWSWDRHAGGLAPHVPDDPDPPAVENRAAALAGRSGVEQR